MGILQKLFGKKRDAADDCAGGADLIHVYDAYGRELAITKQEWRDKILLDSLESARHDPERLHQMIVAALADGFAEDVLPYAEHLHRTDTIFSRGATLLAVVYMQLNRLDDAERVLQQYLRLHGEDAYVLTNLAKIWSRRGDHQQAISTLWHSLELDPNQDNGLGWYEAIAREQGGDAAGIEALKRIAAVPGAWRARLWLAHCALQENHLDDALRLYEEALALAPRPVPVDLLMQLSGDLGNHGHLVELLRLAGPHFDAPQHGLEVGNNLLKANVELGRCDHAQQILEQLYALNRPDYQQPLAQWDTAIATARTKAQTESLQGAPVVTMLNLAGPIWFDPASPAAALFPPKDADAVMICFLGGSADLGESGGPRVGLSDTAGRLTRALSLFLCEQLHFRTDGAGQVLQPFVVGGDGGFVLSGKSWDDELAAERARQCQPPADYVVVTHLEATGKKPFLSARLLRTIDGSQLEGTQVPVDCQHPEAAFDQLAAWLVKATCQQAGVEPIKPAEAYQVPRGEYFNDYLLRIEQALAVTCAATAAASPRFLHGEREIVAGTLNLCLEQPANITARVLLAALLDRMRRVNAPAVAESRQRVERLQAEYPLPAPAADLVGQMLDAVFADES